MSIDQRRRALLLLACFSPFARAGQQPAPTLPTLPADRPVDLIHRVFAEVLASPRQIAASTEMRKA